MTVSSYYGKLNTLWEELSKHVPLISCHCCTKCTAGLLHQERREHEKLHDFLVALYSEYCARLRTQILSIELLPSLDRAYQLAIRMSEFGLPNLSPMINQARRLALPCVLVRVKAVAPVIVLYVSIVRR